MTIDDQIRDEKLQYNINREVAKLSALSSNKIGKYGYLTCEEILPYNQKQIIKQAKLTYSPLGKAFEKETKTIEDQGKKQVETLKGLKPEAIKSESNNEPLITTEIFDKILDERMDEIIEMSREINFNNLIYHFKGPSPSKNEDANSNIEAGRNSLKNVPKKRYISPEGRQQIIDDLRLV